MKFSEVQEILHKNFGIDHLADIARELGVSPQAVSNWKARNKVPYKYIVMLRKKEPMPQQGEALKKFFSNYKF